MAQQQGFMESEQGGALQNLSRVSAWITARVARPYERGSVVVSFLHLWLYQHWDKKESPWK